MASNDIPSGEKGDEEKRRLKDCFSGAFQNYSVSRRSAKKRSQASALERVTIS